MLSLLLVPLGAEKVEARNLWQRIVQTFWPKEKKRKSRPTGRPKGNSSRDRCPYVKTPLTALVPQSEDGISTIEKTTLGYPVLWFFNPYKSVLGKKAEIVVFDEKEKTFFSKEFNLNKGNGFIRLEIKNLNKKLRLNKNYTWIFSIICDSQNRTSDVTVKGYIQRVKVKNLKNQKTETLSNEIVLDQLIKHEIWHDSLDILITKFKRNHTDTDNLKYFMHLFYIDIKTPFRFYEYSLNYRPLK